MGLTVYKHFINNSLKLKLSFDKIEIIQFTNYGYNELGGKCNERNNYFMPTSDSFLRCALIKHKTIAPPGAQTSAKKLRSTIPFSVIAIREYLNCNRDPING